MLTLTVYEEIEMTCKPARMADIKIVLFARARWEEFEADLPRFSFSSGMLGLNAALAAWVCDGTPDSLFLATEHETGKFFLVFRVGNEYTRLVAEIGIRP